MNIIFINDKIVGNLFVKNLIVSENIGTRYVNLILGCRLEKNEIELFPLGFIL